MRCEFASESALIFYLGDTASASLSAQIQALDNALRAALASKLVDTVPSYGSLLVVYNPLATDHYEVRAYAQQAFDGMTEGTDRVSKVIELPVYYSTESGPDLENLAASAGMTTDQVIDMHSAGEYPVYAIGFAPGFAYLGGLDEKLATPRLSTPRQRVPAGSVAIADQQTAVYPAESPGGWNLIGLCPTPMFNANSEPHMPVAAGDVIKFKPITRDQFLELGGTL